MESERRVLDVCLPQPTLMAKARLENGYGGAEYALKPATRAFASTARLNLQHYLWKEQTGFLLHPDIPLDGRTDLKIADVGTGTGIWLLDLARSLPPTAQLDGFDIDISDCPAEPWLPRNVTMRHLDAFEEIPGELVGLYDVVQLRLFQVVVRDNDPGPLLRNVVKMLKPGGYIQWAEYDMTTQTTIKATPDLPSPALDAIVPFVQGIKEKNQKVGVQNWIPHLPDHFTAHALDRVTSTRHAPHPHCLPSNLDVFLLTYEELAAKTLDRMPGGQGDRLRALVQTAGEEGRRGVGWGIERVVVVGRKGGVGVGEGKMGEEKEEGRRVRSGIWSRAWKRVCAL